MQKKLKMIIPVMAFCLTAAPGWSMDLKYGETDYGDLQLFAKAMHILDAADNGYDPSDGTGYLLKAKYLSPSFSDFQVGLGLYANGDLFGLTDFDLDPSTERLARGMFVTDDGATEFQLGEAYLTYKHENFSVHGGREMYKTPLTTITYSTMPNFYSVLGGSTTFSDTKLGLAQIFEMSFGARSMTDFGLIGEGTKSAGAAIKTSTIGQAEFHDIGIATFGNNGPNTNGITVFSAEYAGFKNVTLELWDYYVDDIANNIYAEVKSVFPFKSKGMKLKLDGQYLNQQDTGSRYAGNLNFDLWGLKATLASKQWAVFAGYNNSGGDRAMLNAWGGDPAYTGTIFSRNAYRENVSAYKVGFKYKFLKKWTLVAAYADYGMSDTAAPAKVIKVGAIGFVDPVTDATELDLVVIYKPTKKSMLKIFYADRTSEYDGTGNGRELEQQHLRFVGSIAY